MIKDMVKKMRTYGRILLYIGVMIFLCGCSNGNSWLDNVVSEKEMQEEVVQNTEEKQNPIEETTITKPKKVTKKETEPTVPTKSTIRYPELSDRMIDLLIKPIREWFFYQKESFDKLDNSHKVEMCAVAAMMNQEIEHTDAGMLVRSDIFESCLKTYFGEVFDWKTINRTNWTSIQNNGVILYWGDLDHTLNFCYDLVSINKISEGQYIALVDYYIEDQFGIKTEYARVTFEFAGDMTLDSTYYIKDIKYEYCYPGDDYLIQIHQECTESIGNQIAEHYTKEWKPEGTYVVFSDEASFDWDGKIVYILRYQMSDKEAEERIQAGMSVAPNVFAAEVWVDMSTWEVSEGMTGDDLSEKTWKLEKTWLNN